MALYAMNSQVQSCCTSQACVHCAKHSLRRSHSRSGTHQRYMRSRSSRGGYTRVQASTPHVKSRWP
jgi:hypothetical protein